MVLKDEAFFDVVKNQKTPFKITTESPIKTNIKIDPDEKAKPCNEVWVLFFEWFTKFKIFKEKTQLILEKTFKHFGNFRSEVFSFYKQKCQTNYC